MATSVWKSGFNAKYLLEIASQVDRENAVFMFNSAGDPTLMREGNDTSRGLCCHADAGVEPQSGEFLKRRRARTGCAVLP